MKIICEICGKVFNYPIEQMMHRHKEVEMDLVPPNFWEIKDYSSEFGISFLGSGELVLPKKMVKSKYKVGNTPLIQYASNVFLKDESANITGSFKDRGMENLMNEILMHNKKIVTFVSCGSGAISTIFFAREFGIKTVAFVHKGIDESSLELISKADDIYYSENFIKSYEDFMKYSLHHDEVFCGFLNTNISYMLGLRSLAYEIIRDIKEIPDTIIIPCGSGMNIVAQNLAFREMYKARIIPKIPKIGVVEIIGGNPIEEGFNKNVQDYLYVIDKPASSKTILSNDTCFNYKKIFEIAKSREAFFISVCDKEIDEFISEHLDFKDKYDYTSISAMAALEKYIKVNDKEKVVVVITCKNRNGGK